MTRNTIVYFGGFKLPDKNAAAHRVMANAKILSELGFKVKLIGLSSNGQKEVIERIELNNDYDIELYSIPYPSNAKEWTKYLFAINHIKDVIDESVGYVFFYNFQSFSFLRLSTTLKKRGIKCVADCTEWYGTPQGNFIKKIIKNIDTSLRMRWINRKKMDGIVTISRFLDDYYADSRTLLLPPLVDKRDAKWTNTISDVDFVNGKVVNFIYAGQPGQDKDRLREVVLALNDVKDDTKRDIVFNIIGIDEKQFLETGIPLFNFIKLHGRVSHLEVIQKIKEADFVIFIRDDSKVNKAGFPTKFVEALSCGTPVITNSSSNISDFLKDGVNGFLVSNSQGDLKEEIGRIVDLDKKAILTMKNYCRNDSTFDYRNYIDRFDTFLNKL